VSKCTIIKEIVIILLVAVLCIVLYWLWFGCISDYPIEEKQITFSFITEPILSDSTLKMDRQKILDENQTQIDSIRNLISQISDETNRISDKIKNCEYLNVSNLSAFYAALFTVIAVIVAIVGVLGWRVIGDYKKDFEKHKQETEEVVKEARGNIKQYEEIKRDVEFIHQKREHTQWIESKFKDISNQNLESLILSSQKDRERLKKIKDHVIQDIKDCSWLELIYAFTQIDEKNLDQAEIILKYLECRVILDESYLETQMRHIKGQLYWKKYQNYSDKYNFFMNNSGKPKPDENVYKQALECLKNAEDSYKILLDKEEAYGRNMNFDEARGNYAMVLIKKAKLNTTKKYFSDYYKIFASLKSLQEDFLMLDKSPLNEAKTLINKNINKSFYHLWDLARIKYYTKLFLKMEKIYSSRCNIKDKNIKTRQIFLTRQDMKSISITLSDLNEIIDEFVNNICSGEKIDEHLFYRQIEKEQREFCEKGFPGKEELIKRLKKEIKQLVNK